MLTAFELAGRIESCGLNKDDIIYIDSEKIIYVYSFDNVTMVEMNNGHVIPVKGALADVVNKINHPKMF